MVVTDVARLIPIERVRCLECAVTYVKPCGGTTMRRNPGCPRCGYVGWIAASVPPEPIDSPRRPIADRAAVLQLRPR